MTIDKGREIKSLLVSKGMKQSELAVKCGISLTYLNQIINGRYIDEEREAVIVAEADKLKAGS